MHWLAKRWGCKHRCSPSSNGARRSSARTAFRIRTTAIYQPECRNPEDGVLLECLEDYGAPEVK